MATIENERGGLHEVVIVSVDIAGNIEYFDPGTGKYGGGDLGDIVKVYSIEPKEHPFP